MMCFSFASDKTYKRFMSIMTKEVCEFTDEDRAWFNRALKRGSITRVDAAPPEIVRDKIHNIDTIMPPY